MTHSMTMTVRVDASIEPGTYPINLTHYYKTKDQQNKTSEDQISVYVAGKPTSSEANVSLGAFRSNMESIAPGGTVTISAPVQNLGDGEATQVRVNYEPGDAADIILTSDPYYFSTMEAGYNDTVSFTFRASSDAERGTYPIRIKLSYKDEDNELHEETVNTSITVSKDQETGKEPNIEIRDLTAPSGVYKVGETSVFALRVINTGDGIAENVKITATPSDAAAVVPTSGNIQTIRAFNPGEERVINFSFAATEAAKTQSYAVGFNVEYYSGEDDGGEEKEPFKFEQYASVGVDNPEDDEEEGDKTSKPKMIVSRYAVNPQVVQAGREFDLDITFQNTSSVKAIENIKITLEALEVTEDKGSVFNPVGGSNTLFIDEMGIKEELTHNLKWYTVNDAEARSYKLQVRFQYQDEDLNDYEEIEQLAINVKQTTQIEVPDVYFPDTAMVGEEINIYTSIINTGKVRISNLRVRVDVAEGSEFDKRTDMYLSNVGTGNQVQYDGYITMTTPGLQSGTFVAYGEDDTGEPIEFALDFTIDVTDGGGMNGDFGRPGMDVMDPGMTDPGMMDSRRHWRLSSFRMCGERA